MKSLGISQEKAEFLSKNIPSDSPETAQTELDEIYQSVVTHQNDLFKNGDEFKNALKDKHAQALREVSQKSEAKVIKIAGLTAEEVKDKKYDEIVELAWAKASRLNDKTSDELQAELVKTSNELKRLQDEEIPKIKSEVEADKLKFKSHMATLEHVSKLKLRTGTDAEDAIILFDQKLARNGMKKDFDEKGQMIIVNLDGSKVLSEDKKTMLGTGEIFTKLLDGQIEKSGAPEGDDKKKAIITPDKDKKEALKNGSVVNANLNKAAEHAKKLAEKNT